MTAKGVRVGGLVLAAGRATRMGRDKLALPLAEGTVLETTVGRFLAARLSLVAVVVRAGRPPPLSASVAARVVLVENAEADEGMASSIRAGVGAVGARVDALAIGLGDQPFVRPETIDRLVERFARGDADAVYPVAAARRGHPVVVGARLFAALGTLTGDRGARVLLETPAVRAVGLAVDDPGAFADLDTPEDYVKWGGPPRRGPAESKR